MITGLDHAVVLVRRHRGRRCGLPDAARPRAGMAGARKKASPRRFFSLANTSLELMSPVAEGEGADRVRSVLDAQGEGPCKSSVRNRGHRGGASPLRAARAFTVGDFRWRKSRSWHGTHDDMEAHPHGQGTRPAACGCSLCSGPSRLRHHLPRADAPIDALDHIVLATPDPERAAALYGARLGLDMKLGPDHRCLADALPVFQARWSCVRDHPQPSRLAGATARTSFTAFPGAWRMSRRRGCGFSRPGSRSRTCARAASPAPGSITVRTGTFGGADHRDPAGRTGGLGALEAPPANLQAAALIFLRFLANSAGFHAPHRLPRSLRSG